MRRDALEVVVAEERVEIDDAIEQVATERCEKLCGVRWVRPSEAEEHFVTVACKRIGDGLDLASGERIVEFADEHADLFGFSRAHDLRRLVGGVIKLCSEFPDTLRPPDSARPRFAGLAVEHA